MEELRRQMDCLRKRMGEVTPEKLMDMSNTFNGYLIDRYSDSDFDSDWDIRRAVIMIGHAHVWWENLLINLIEDCRK
mgnify:CR=1 FL=1